MPITSRSSSPIDDDDTAYFRGLFCAARKAAKLQDEESVISGARSVLAQMRKTNKAPGFGVEAMTVLENLTALIEDGDYQPLAAVRSRVLGALAYFSNPNDLISDDIRSSVSSTQRWPSGEALPPRVAELARRVEAY